MSHGQDYDSVIMVVDSENCTAGDKFGGPCTFNLTQALLRDVEAVRVKQMGFEMSWYNFEADADSNGIGKNWDVTMYFIGDVTGPFSFPIPAGAYGISDLEQAIITGIFNATGGTIVTVTYIQTTQQLVITVTGGTDTQLQIDFTAAGLAGKTYGLNRLGFVTPAALSAVITADQAYVLMLTDYFMLCSNVFSTINNLASFPRTGESPGILRSNVIFQFMTGQANNWTFSYNQIPSAFYRLNDAGQLANIDFSVIDRNGFPLVLHQKGWNAMFEFEIKKGAYS